MATKKVKGPVPAPFQLHGDEFFVECPYDMSHQITNFRMTTHLVKCRRNYQKKVERQNEPVLMLTCKYNWQHHCPAPEILYHEKYCSDRYNIIPHLLEYIEHYDPSNPQVFRKRYELYLTKGVGNNNYLSTITLSKNACDEVPDLTAVSTVEDDGDNSGVLKHDGFSNCTFVNSKILTEDTASSNSRPKRAEYSEETKRILAWDEEEDWELDCANRTQTYDPRVKMDQELTLKYPPNLSKSERKKWKITNIEKAKRLWTFGSADIPDTQSDIFGPNSFFRPRPETPPPSNDDDNSVNGLGESNMDDNPIGDKNKAKKESNPDYKNRYKNFLNRSINPEQTSFKSRIEAENMIPQVSKDTPNQTARSSENLSSPPKSLVKYPPKSLEKASDKEDKAASPPKNNDWRWTPMSQMDF